LVAVRRLRVAHAQKKKKHAGSTLARKKEMERGRAGGRVRLAVVLMYHQIRGEATRARASHQPAASSWALLSGSTILGWVAVQGGW